MLGLVLRAGLEAILDVDFLPAAPYAAQVQLTKKEIEKMSPLEINRDLVEVRSITSAMGHEADILLVDFTSAEKASFTEEME